MAADKQRGLGRGLSALLGESQAQNVTADAPAPAPANEIFIELIEANPNQPRRQFAQAELLELAQSITEKGVLQPILVRPAPGRPGRYQIVAGERRWRAAQHAGLRALPAVIRELEDRDVLEIAIIENVQRVDLNPLEEAQGYQSLIDSFGHTQDDVAKMVSKSRSHVANTLRLLNLPQGVREHLAAGRLTAGHARAIATADNPDALAERIVSGGLSVRDAEALARKGGAGTKSSSKAAGRFLGSPDKDADTRALEEDLESVLGLRVQVLDKSGVGEVRIAYATLEQLDDLCRRLTRT